MVTNGPSPQKGLIAGLGHEPRHLGSLLDHLAPRVCTRSHDAPLCQYVDIMGVSVQRVCNTDEQHKTKAPRLILFSTVDLPVACDTSNSSGTRIF